MPTPSGRIPFTAIAIQDGFGNLLEAGTLSIEITDGKDVPINGGLGGSPGGQLISGGAVAITNGAIPSPSYIPDTTQTRPADLCLRLTIRDGSGAAVRTYTRVQTVDNTGTALTTFDLDTYVPNVAAQAIVQYGPPGPAGTIVSATATGLSNGASPTVTLGGSPSARTIQFGIPAGAQGADSTVPGPTGASGSAGANGFASAPALAGVLSVLPFGLNLLKLANVVADKYVDQSNGTLVSYSGSSVIDVAANSGGKMTLCGVACGDSGYAWLDQNKAYISGAFSPFPGGDPSPRTVTVPDGACFLRIAYHSDQIGQAMIVWGDQTPPGYPTYQGYGVYASSVVDAMIASLTASTTTTAARASAVIDRLPIGRNWINPETLTADHYLDHANGTLSSYSGFSVTDYIPVEPGVDITLCGSVTCADSGYAWFNSDFTYNSGALSPFPGGDPSPRTITPPSGAYFLRITYITGYYSAAMIVRGTALPSVFTPFRPVVPTHANIAPLISHIDTCNTRGLKVAFWGDSLTQVSGPYWQPTLLTRLGLTNVFQDAHAGRGIAQMFECYNNNPTSGTNQISGSPAAGYSNSAYGSGLTLAGDLSASAPDIGVVLFGSNDFGGVASNLGAPGDAITATTLYGQYLNFLTKIQLARPQMRVFVFGPHISIYDTTGALQAQMDTMMSYVSAQLGMVYTSMRNNSGINQITDPAGGTYLYTVDGIHFSALGGSTRIGPSISGALERWL